MKLRLATAAALIAPSVLALTGAGAPALGHSPAAATCQGRPASIEGSTGTITGTEGDDVIVSTGPDTTVQALGGNDVICVVGGQVNTGPGDDAVLSTGPVQSTTSVYLVGGNDTFVGGLGASGVVVDAITSFHVTLTGVGFGTVQLNPATVPGTGTIDFGTTGNVLYAFGLESAAVDLARGTVAIDGLLDVTTTGLHNATATGCRVRLRGDDDPNTLNAYGHDVVLRGGGGGDRMGRVGNGFDLDLPRCDRYKSVVRGESGPDHLYGRLGDDVLVGGPGRDHANGAGGKDTCRAEVERNCER